MSARPFADAAPGPGRRLEWLGIALVLAILVALQFVPGRVPVLGALEAQSLTARFQIRGPVAPGDEVVLVMIDDATVARFGRWPLPRELMARAVERLAQARARVIVFDLLFAGTGAGLTGAEAAALARARAALAESDPALARELDRVLGAQAGDRRLAEAIAAVGNVVIPFAFVFDRSDANIAELPASLAGAAYPVTVARDGGAAGPVRPAGVLAPVEAVARAAAALGHVTVSLDPDGQLRYGLPAVAFDGAWYPSLPVEAARLYLGLAPAEVAPVLGDGLRLGGRRVSTDRLMRLAVNHYGPTGTFPRVSFADLVDGRVDPDMLAGRIVMVGGAALGIGDNFATPFAQTLPGTEFYATVVDNLLHGRSLVRDGTTAALDILAIVVLGLCAALLARFGPLALSSVGVVALLVIWAEIDYLAFAHWNLWVAFVPGAAALILVFVWSATLGIVRVQRARARAERHRRNLTRYFSPAVVDAIVERDDPYGFDRAGPAAVVFVDLAGSTALSEHMTPEEAMALLRAFQARVVRAVFGRGGSVDKFLGDGAMACFGMPVPDDDAAANALAAARDLAADMEAWNAERREAGEPALGFGIGLHYGPVLAGDLGGGERFEFTVAGDTVNVASRLEGLTRTLGVRIVASAAAVEAARGAGAPADALDGFTAMPPQPIRGREAPIEVWVWPAPPGTGG